MTTWVSMTHFKLDVEDEVVDLGESLVIVAAVRAMKV